jgi:putative ABC transport system substrate-binding protein
MKIFASILTLFCLLVPRPSYGDSTVVVLQGSDFKPYTRAVRGFEEICKAKTREIRMKGKDASSVVREVRRAGPDLILAVGLKALRAVKSVEDVPIVYMMVSGPESVLAGEKNITGVSMNVPARRQLGALIRMVPNLATIGIAYSPKKTGRLFAEAEEAAAHYGISVVSMEVRDPRQAPPAIKAMSGRIDAFWMFPDTTFLMPESLKYLFLFSFEEGVPVLTFSEKFVEMGALMSLNIDEYDIGRQAGEMAVKILEGAATSDIPAAPPRRTVLSINPRAAKHFGLSANEASKGALR